MKDVLIMTQAYELLYNIEVILRQTINEKMRTGYGIAWEHRIKEKHSFANCYYHELIPYFAKYSPLQKIFTEKERKQLYQLTPIRNKICHMKKLDPNDYTFLKECHLLVKRTCQYYHEPI